MKLQRESPETFTAILAMLMGADSHCVIPIDQIDLNSEQ